MINCGITEKHSDVSLVLDEPTFVDMVLNFLGKKEKLNYHIRNIYFFIRLNDIEQFYYLLNNKISKEQYVHIEHFLVTILYNDGTIREISGIQSLNNFIETRDVIPTDIIISWNIIIKYPNANTIENQKIELAFIKEGEDGNSEVILNIRHTNQAWGIEVLNLFKDKIGELTNKQSKKSIIIDNLLNNKFVPSSLYFIMFYVLILLFATIYYAIQRDYGYYKSSDNYYKIASYYKKTQSLIEKDIALFSVQALSPDDLRESANNIIVNPELRKVMLDIADYNTNKLINTIKFFAYILLSPFIIYILTRFYLKKARFFYWNESFILISRRSESEHEQYIRNKDRVQFYSITSLVIASLCGVVGNIIYQIITKFI